jgi:hypothetical protein
MTKIKFEIKNRWTGKILFEYEKENNTFRETILEAIKSKANLSEADLSEANLSKANLSKADLSKANLSWADLSKADLSWANLSWANLSWADLSWADLSWADLSVIKADFFYVLLHSKAEISFLRQSVIDGKIDGSTYEGECACLSGTTYKGATINNGPQEQEMKKLIMSCRDGNRPAERFFLAIKPGDTPENNAVSKVVLGWIDEFLLLIEK